MKLFRFDSSAVTIISLLGPSLLPVVDALAETIVIYGASGRVGPTY